MIGGKERGSIATDGNRAADRAVAMVKKKADDALRSEVYKKKDEEEWGDRMPPTNKVVHKAFIQALPSADDVFGAIRPTARQDVAPVAPKPSTQENVAESMTKMMEVTASGNIVEAVRHMRSVQSAIKRLTVLGDEELMAEAKQLGAPYELVRLVAREGKLPVPNFAAGGIATPADTSLMMQLGAEAVFVGSGIFKSGDPVLRARAIVRAVTNYRDPSVLVEVSKGLGEPMVGINNDTLPEDQLIASRGV